MLSQGHCLIARIAASSQTLSDGLRSWDIEIHPNHWKTSAVFLWRCRKKQLIDLTSGWTSVFTLEVKPPFFIGWFTNHHYFSRGLSSSKRSFTIFLMVATTSRVYSSSRTELTWWFSSRHVPTRNVKGPTALPVTRNVRERSMGLLHLGAVEQCGFQKHLEVGTLKGSRINWVLNQK